MAAFTLPVQSWTQDPQPLQLVVMGPEEQQVGRVEIEAVARLVLRLENFDRFVGCEESEEETEGSCEQEPLNRVGQDVHEELVRVRRSLEDCEYLCSKLKSDRDRYSSEAESLQRQAS